MSDVLITPVATASFPYIFKPGVDDYGVEKYSVTLVFDPGAEVKPLKEAALRAAKKKWGAEAVEMIRAGELHMPFRTDGRKKGYPDGSVFITPTSLRPPGVVSIMPDEDGLPARITNPAEIYPGVRIRASVQAFSYVKKGKKGVAFGLRNIQKVADGERLDGGVDPRYEFEADPAVAADLAEFDAPGTPDMEQDDLADLL